MRAPSALAHKIGRARLKVARARRVFGLPGAAVAVLGLMHRALVLSLRLVIRPFLFLFELATDAWLGVDTRAEADSKGAIKALTLGGDPEDYEPVNLLWWMRMFSAVPLDPTQTTFVDLGAGRGRALILAARMGFRRVIGVELDERLASDAGINIARWSSRGGANRKNQEIRVVRTDAASFTMPPGPLVVSLFNPFGCPGGLSPSVEQGTGRAGAQDRPATGRSGLPGRHCNSAALPDRSQRSRLAAVPASDRWPSDCGPGRGRPWAASRRTHPHTLQVGGNPFGRETSAWAAGVPRKDGYCSVRTDHRGGARRPLPLGPLAKPTM
jgi:hypothetical protein